MITAQKIATGEKDYCSKIEKNISKRGGQVKKFLPLPMQNSSFRTCSALFFDLSTGPYRRNTGRFSQVIAEIVAGFGIIGLDGFLVVLNRFPRLAEI